MKALEFYSGIGGLHLALSRSNAPGSVAQAFDWDQNAREVYSANFGPGIATKMDISALTAAYLAPINASLWLLSPACQPYTVLNPSAKGELDPRAKSFLHLVQNVLPELARGNAHPTHFLVENVGGFETSSTRQILVSTLRSLGYTVAEFLLTPLQFGIPNSRLRYYLLAKRSPFSFRSPQNRDGETLRYIPGRGDEAWVDLRLVDPESNLADADDTVHEIREYLDSEPVEGCGITDKILCKWGRLFDIVLPSSRRTCCFTRGYTQLVERSGSILQMNEGQDTTSVFDAFLQSQSSTSTEAAHAVRILDTLRLRYFSPEELLRLFAFTPPHTSNDTPQNPLIWPDGISRKTKYRLIGNSVNVKVVQELISYLFEEP
ncbi:S-adenosyl-L-methionine-dependent methyltransferase [Mycena latifolia]|nr:S-adenosyl-L-methionine-dependent methyltransferase [Mycena latifolia]